LVVDFSVEGEVGVRVKYDPIRIGEVPSPVLNAGESVSDGNVETLANAGDFTEHVVSLDVAAQCVSESR
jgi:hypothetical protein